MLNRIAQLAMAAPRRVLAVTALVMVAAAIFGISVAKTLSAGGFQDPTSQSSQATALLTEKFDQGDMQMLVAITAPDGVDSPAAKAAAADIVGAIEQSPHTSTVTSAWTAPPRARPRC